MHPLPRSCPTDFLPERWQAKRERQSMDDGTGRDTYTAEQREPLESGLRILARMIARAQLRWEDVLLGKGGSERKPHAQKDHSD